MLERGSNVNQPDREALKRAREEWEKEIELEVDAKMADEVGHQRRRKGIYEEICRAKWGNTTIDNIMYLSRIHSTLHDEDNRRIVSDLEPPIIAASRNGHDKIVALLLENGAEVDIIHKNPRETIFATAVAAKAGHVEVVRTLLDHGALVDGPREVLDYFFREPLTVAVKADKTEVAELLVARGARVFPCCLSLSSLHTAAENNNLALLKLFLASGYTVDHPSLGGSPLAWAAKHGSSAAAELLIGAGADVEYTDPRGDTPLLLAVKNGSVGVTQALLAAGADLEVRTSVQLTTANHTALQVALVEAS